MARSRFVEDSKRIEDYLSKSDRAQTTQEIAQGLEMTTSSIHTLLQLMEVFGTVQKAKRGSYYYFLKGVYDEEQILALLPPERVKPRRRRGSKYDPILDQFIDLDHNLVEINVKGKKPGYISSQLMRRIKKRKLRGIVASSTRDIVYLEKA